MNASIGIVLLHGKYSSGQDPVLAKLASKLKGEGYLVATPTMAWSKDRIYDASVDEALSEIDKEVDALRDQGATRISIAGFSLGGGVAIRYAAMREGFDALIALAPAQSPDHEVNQKRFAPHLTRARQLIAEGKGDEVREFYDVNLSDEITVRATPRNYVTWWGEDGALVMPKNMEKIRRSIPTLFVVGGQKDITTRPREHVYDKAPLHPLSQYVSIDTDHWRVPVKAWSTLKEWLAKLGDPGQPY